jgi:membrane protease YdiL (CAAX protease family)
MISAKTALTPKDLLLMVSGAFLCYLLLGAVPARLFHVLNDPGTESVMAGMGILAIIYHFAKKLGSTPKDMRRYLSEAATELKPALKYWLLLTILLYVLEALIAAALAAGGLTWPEIVRFWNRPGNNPMVADEYISSMMSSPAKIPMFFFSLCFIAPLIEEFIMRRGLYVTMRKRMPFALAVLVNGALFGLLHGKEFWDPMLVGMFLCYVYEKRGRFSTVVLVHAYANLFVFLNIFSGRLFGVSFP